MINIILFFGQKMKIVCDEKCEKAWGKNNRPRILLSEDGEDNFVLLADSELGIAPQDPGTYEGSDAKPTESWEKPNKWCVRECERCNKSRPGEHLLPLDPIDFSQRRQSK